MDFTEFAMGFTLSLPMVVGHMFLKKILPVLALAAALLTSHVSRAEEKATMAKRCTVMAFNVENLHANDVCTLLDQAGVATRSGHHCTQPLHRYLDVNATARASAYIYNTPNEVDVLVEALRDTIGFFKDINGA